MENTSKAMSRRERRRKQNDEKCESEGNEDIIVKRNEAAEKHSKEDGKSSRILVRRETFTVLKRGTAFESAFSNEKEKSDDNKDESSIGGNEMDAPSDSEDSKNLTHTINVETWNTDSRNLTYDVNEEKLLSKHDTYNIQMTESERPVPAPRKRQNIPNKEPDKNSSDTDRDVMEIEVDEGNTPKEMETPEKQPVSTTKRTVYESDTSVEEPPKPKPRKLSSISAAFPRTDSISKSKSLEEITVKVISPRSTKSDPERKHGDNGESLIEERPKPPKTEEKGGRKRRFAALLQRRKDKKASKLLSSVMKLERTRMPTISSLLRDIKEDVPKEKLEDDDRIDFEIDSPRLPQSVPNDKVYVQYKNGFYIMNKEEVFKKDENLLKRDVGGGRMEDSVTSNMLKTGMFFQKYWSRLIVHIHGVLAGLGFGHAFAITIVLFYFNKSEGFIDVYACLALKIYFVFYTLIAVCIISCLDRLDIGHMSKKHWSKICSKNPSSWCVLMMYTASFLLTFANHNTEFRFDSLQYGNATGEKLWDPEVHDGVTNIFSCWYRIVWARDVMVLAAWLLISLTEYPDNLFIYLQDLSSESDKLSDGRKLRIAVS